MEIYSNVNLQKSVNKIQFSLMDSNNKLIGSIYKDHKNLYNPDNNVSILSYLPFAPEVSIGGGESTFNLKTNFA